MGEAMGKLGNSRRGLELAALAGVFCTVACYGGKRATQDVNSAWEGRSRGAIEAKWGTPAAVQADGDDTLVIWTHVHHRIELPTASAQIDIGPGRIDARGEIRPGSIRKSTTEVVARLDARDIITGVRGPSLRWGRPNGVNMRWGFLFGAHAGMGRLDDTGTPLPSGGLYIGGMLTRTVGLVGTYSMAAGSDDAGGAMAFGWGVGLQWWTSARWWLRAGPAMVLAFDPGFDNVGLEPGLATGASYAIVRGESFVFDLRADLTIGSSTTFSTLGFGVNIN